MTPTVYAVPTEKTSPLFSRAFAQGCGGSVVTDGRLRPGPVALFGSPQLWPLLTAAQQDGRTWYYGDHGYFGRGDYYRVTRNAYQCTTLRPSDGRRFATFQRPVQPWRRTGRTILLCPQSATYHAHFGMEVGTWLAEVREAIAQVSDRPLLTRTKQTARPLAEDLRDAWAVVTYSSAAALDAVIAGVPVFVLAAWASAARFGLADLARIESPIYPDDREPFLWALADQQWTLAELRQGVAWRALTAEAVPA